MPKTINDLPTSATSVASGDLLHVWQSATSKKITGANLFASGLTVKSAAGSAATTGMQVGAATVGLFSGGSGATEYVGISANGAEYARFTGGAIDCRGGNSIHLFGGDTASATTRTDATNKQFLIGCPHRTNAQPALLAISAFSSAGAGQVLIGGGQASRNAATQVSIHAAANNTTTIGTEMVRCTTAGVRIQSGVSAAASDIFHVYSNTLSQSLILCGEATGGVGLCAAAVPTGTRAFAAGTSALADGTDACAIGNGASAVSNYSYAIGRLTAANAAWSMALGNRATARSVSGKLSISASGEPIATSTGVTQIGMLCLGRQTTDATPTVLCSTSSAAGTANQHTLPNNSAYKFRGTAIATVTAAGDTASWTIDGCIKRGANAASTVLVGTPTVTQDFANAGAAAWVLAVTADTTNGCIAVTATGAAATTIRWNCYLQTTEVTY